MALKYGIFEGDYVGVDENNIPIYDRTVDEEFLEQYIGGLFTNGIGVFVEDCFQVISELNNQVTLKAGVAIINGKMAFDLLDSDPIDLPDSPITYDRYDRLVLRRDNLAREIKIMFISGVESVAPVVPDPVRTENYHDLVFASILRSPLDTVTQSVITDNRMDAELCGVIAPKTNVLDNTDLFAQFTAVFNEMKADLDQDFLDWEALFQAWFDDLQTTLSGDVAGNLLLRIQASEDDIDLLQDKTVSGTITTTWQGTEPPYTQTFSNTDVTTTNTVDITLDPNATEEETTAYDDLAWKDGGQAAGEFTLKAWGIQNVVDIPIIISVKGA